MTDTNQSLPDRTGLVERPNLHNADEIAAFLSEWLTVGDGSLRGVPFVAVLIAEAADSLSTRVKELEARAKAAEKALVSLTPDGSEFYSRDGDGFRVDVLACMAYIRRRRDDQHKTICNAIRERKAAEASLQQMRKALEPFAEFAGASGFGMLPDDMPMTQGSRFARRQVTAGDFKQARATLSTITEDQP